MKIKPRQWRRNNSSAPAGAAESGSFFPRVKSGRRCHPDFTRDYNPWPRWGQREQQTGFSTEPGATLRRAAAGCAEQPINSILQGCQSPKTHPALRDGVWHPKLPMTSPDNCHAMTAFHEFLTLLRWDMRLACPMLLGPAKTRPCRPINGRDACPTKQQNPPRERWVL